MTRFASALAALLLTVTAAGAEEFSKHPRQPDGAKAAMQAVVETCVVKADHLAFDQAYARELKVQVQNLFQVYAMTDAAGLANRQARRLIFAICDTLEEIVPDVEARRWWDFLRN